MTQHWAAVAKQAKDEVQSEVLRRRNEEVCADPNFASWRIKENTDENRNTSPSNRNNHSRPRPSTAIGTRASTSNRKPVISAAKLFTTLSSRPSSAASQRSIITPSSAASRGQRPSTAMPLRASSATNKQQQGQWIDCTVSFKDGRFVGPKQEEGVASVVDSSRKPSPTRKSVWTKECQPRISAPKGQLRITTRPRPKTALTTVTAKRQRQRPISMKELESKTDGRGFLFNMPRPASPPPDDGERPAPPRKQYADAKKWRCELTSFEERSTKMSFDMSYRDTFNRSMSRLDSRFVGLKAEVFPKMASPANVRFETLRRKPGPGATISAGSNFRLLEGALDQPINF